MNKRRNSCINILKCITCLALIFAHVSFPGTVGVIFKYLPAYGFPFFILIAGFYAYGCDEERIKAKLKRMAIIFMLSVFIWFCCKGMLAHFNNGFLNWIKESFSWKTPIKMVLFCTIEWAVPLWYLIAMIETYLLWFWVVKKNLQGKITGYTWALLVIEQIVTCVVDSLHLNWFFKVNFLIRALPWFMLGYLIKERYLKTHENVCNGRLIAASLVGVVITLSAVLTKCPVNYNNVGILLTAPSLLLLGAKNPSMTAGKVIDFIGDKLSLYIYILHPLLSEGLLLFLRKVGFETTSVYEYVHPILIMILSIVVSFPTYLIFNRFREKDSVSQ